MPDAPSADSEKGLVMSLAELKPQLRSRVAGDAELQSFRPATPRLSAMSEPPLHSCAGGRETGVNLPLPGVSPLPLPRLRNNHLPKQCSLLHRGVLGKSHVLESTLGPPLGTSTGFPGLGLGAFVLNGRGRLGFCLLALGRENRSKWKGLSEGGSQVGTDPFPLKQPSSYCPRQNPAYKLEGKGKGEGEERKGRERKEGRGEERK